MDLELFRRKIKESKIKKSAFKDALGCTYYTFQQKMEGKTDFTVKEANVLSNMLHLTNEERLKIFFG